MNRDLPDGGEWTTVKVRLFASLREQAGWSESLVRVRSAEATPRSLWRHLQLPSSGSAEWISAAESGVTIPAAPAVDAGPEMGWPAGMRVAINQAFAAVDTPLADGDELAFLPPISGG